ncbi:MAG: radical SAM protein, partial [Pseudomonadota bacterium]
TEECQLRCAHCYMGDRLDRATVMPLGEVESTLEAWRRLGGSKLTLLGGDPSLHPQFEECVKIAYEMGYEKVILTTNGLKQSRNKISKIPPKYLNYVQISLDGGSADTHDLVRGKNTFKYAIETAKVLAGLGHDIRLICTVNRKNMDDCLKLVDIADEAGFTLVKYHVFSSIGAGGDNADWALKPHEWLDFVEVMKAYRRDKHRTQIWFQPTYARKEQLSTYQEQGYRGCVGRTMDRISIFPDGRCYICSYLFDTDLHFAEMIDGDIKLNRKENEFDLFLSTLTNAPCDSCAGSGGCGGDALLK